MNFPKFQSQSCDDPAVFSAAAVWADMLEFDGEVAQPIGAGYAAERVADVVGILPDVQKILASDKPAVLFHNNPDGSYRLDAIGLPKTSLTKVGQLFLSLQGLPYREQVRQLIPTKIFHPEVELIYSLIDDPLFREAQAGLMTNRLLDGQLYGQHLNQRLGAIRKEAKKASFRKKVSDWVKPVIKNQRTLEDYLDFLVGVVECAQVVKVDLGYGPGYQQVATPDEMMQAFRELVDQGKDRGIFNGLIGYVVRLDHNLQKGFFLSAVFIFDAVQLSYSDDMTLAIGWLWRNCISPHRGHTFWRCDRCICKHHGIGPIEHQAWVCREYFAKHTAAYMARIDEFVRLNVEGRDPFWWIVRGELSPEIKVEGKKVKQPKHEQPQLFLNAFSDSGWAGTQAMQNSYQTDNRFSF